MLRRTIGWLGVAVVACGLLAPAARACTIPVFRYALERWEASPYDVIVFCKGDLTAKERETVEAMARPPANIEIRAVDVTQKMDEADQAVWGKQRAAGMPWVVVRFPDSGENAPAAWAGQLNEAAVTAVTDSPARRELAKRLLAGQSAVWVVVEQGEASADDALVVRLEKELRRLERTLVLPEIAADGPQLKSPLPLKIAFSILRVKRDDPKEAALVRMLSAAEPELMESKESLVVPVVGRARAVSSLPASKVNAERLRAFAEFICGQCSCEVKELNPGIDLLVAAEWETIFEEGAAAKEEERPVAKAGEAVPIPPAVVATTTAPVVTTAPATGEGQKIDAGAAPAGRRPWLWAGVSVAALAAVVSGVVVMRARGK